MDDSRSQEIGDRKIAGICADKSWSSNKSALAFWPPITVLDQQTVRAPASDRAKQAPIGSTGRLEQSDWLEAEGMLETDDRPDENIWLVADGRHKADSNSNTDRRVPRFAGAACFVVLLFFIAVGLRWASPDFGHSLQNVFNTVWGITKQIVASPLSAKSSLAVNPSSAHISEAMVTNQHADHQAQEELAAKPESSSPLPTSSSSVVTSSVTSPASAPIAAVPPVKAIAPQPESSRGFAKKPAVIGQPVKPEIRVISVTVGTMVKNRFLPSEDGNIFMVEINYRNFNKVLESTPEVTLVTRLGVAGDAMVLAEVPVGISGDRGTKNFVMEPLMSGDASGKYELNFILNGKLLTSRTIHLPRLAR